MAEVEFAYTGRPDSGGNVAIRRRTEEIGYTPAELAAENKSLRHALWEARISYEQECRIYDEACKELTETKAALALSQEGLHALAVFRTEYTCEHCEAGAAIDAALLHQTI